METLTTGEGQGTFLEMPTGDINQVKAILITNLINALYRLLGESIPEVIIRNQLLKPETSAEVTSLLLSIMIDRVEINLNETDMKLITELLLHHGFEVVSDILEGENATVFAQIASQVIINPDLEVADLQEWRQLKTRLTGINFDPLNIPISNCLLINLKQLAELVRYIRTFDDLNEGVKEEFLKSIEARYQGVSTTTQRGYDQTNTQSNISLRSDTILIRATIYYILSIKLKGSQIEIPPDIFESIQIASELIGIWNDLGSQFVSDLNSLIDFINISRNGHTTLRDIFKVAEQSYPTNIWVQLAKDAKGNEPNMVLDLEIEKAKEVIKILRNISIDKIKRILEIKQYVEQQHTALFPVIKMILSTVWFHYALYRSGDYYGQGTIPPDLQIPIDQILKELSSLVALRYPIEKEA